PAARPARRGGAARIRDVPASRPRRWSAPGAPRPGGCPRARSRSSQNLLKPLAEALDLLARIELGDAEEHGAGQLRIEASQREPADDPARQELARDHSGIDRQIEHELVEDRGVEPRAAARNGGQTIARMERLAPAL